MPDSELVIRGARRSTMITMLIVALLAVPTANAHRLNVFAEPADDGIAGTVYFSGGGKAAGLVVRLIGLEGEEIARTVTNEEGGFRFARTERQAVRIVTETIDGHGAQYSLVSEAAAPNIAQTQPGRPDASEHLSERQLVTLHHRLDRLESQIRFRDVVGGVGYIVGVFGLVCLLRNRRSREEPS